MIVSAQGLGKSFGATRALHEATFDIEEGATGLLGPNGAGKTTLLRILLGLLPADGRASVLGLDPMREPLKVRARLGYMPESECVVPGMPGVEVVAYMGRLAGMPYRVALKRAHEVLYYVGLEEQRYREASEYSQGMQQRLKLAIALVHDPDLLFLDEPTNGLDPKGRVEMLTLIRELAREHRKNVVLSSHLLPDVEEVCSRVIVLSNGRVARVGALADLTGFVADSFEFEVAGEEERFRAELRALGAVVEGSTAKLPPGSDPSLLFRAALASGARIRQLRPVRLTLEEVFLEAVER